MVTNLDIFEDIQDMMKKAKEEKKSYLDALEERKDYMTTYRQEYRKLNTAIAYVKTLLLRSTKSNEEQEISLKKVRNIVDKQIDETRKEQEYYTDGSLDRVLKDLHKVKGLLDGKVKIDDIEEAKIYIGKNNIEIPELNDLLEYFEEGQREVKSGDVKQLLKLIDECESDYLSSFKTYRKACEESEEVFDSFDDIVAVLLEMDFVEAAEELGDALPDVEETRRQRPDPEPLLNILVPFRSNDLEYWKSNYNNSNAHDHNIELADAVAYVRRALLEEREYQGTKNAFDKMDEAYNKLYKYMHARYHELGGKPKNYHGHDSRKRKSK